VSAVVADAELFLQAVVASVVAEEAAVSGAVAEVAAAAEAGGGPISG
jgi:hypothetical protein